MQLALVLSSNRWTLLTLQKPAVSHLCVVVGQPQPAHLASVWHMPTHFVLTGLAVSTMQNGVSTVQPVSLLAPAWSSMQTCAAGRRRGGGMMATGGYARPRQ